VSAVVVILLQSSLLVERIHLDMNSGKPQFPVKDRLDGLGEAGEAFVFVEEPANALVHRFPFNDRARLRLKSRTICFSTG